MQWPRFLIDRLRGFSFVLLFAGGIAADEGLRVGFAEVDITPPIGYRQAGGYGEVISTGIDDPLMAKAMAVAEGDQMLILLISDLTGIADEVSRKAREAIASREKIGVDRVIIAATHNHGAPEYWGPLREIWHKAAVDRHGRDPAETIDYPALLVERWTGVASEAVRKLRPATIEMVIAEQPALAFNRRFHMRDGSVKFNPGKGNPEIVRAAGPVDTDLSCLLVRDSTGQPQGGLTAFAMHTATASGSRFGADFPGHLAARLRRSLGSQFVSLFAEGTAGDVNHIDVHNSDPQAGSIEPARIGNALAKTWSDSQSQMRRLTEGSFALSSETLNWPLRPAIDADRYAAARSLIAEQLANQAEFLDLVAAWRDCHQWELQCKYGDHKPMEVQVVRFDRDTALVALPHEVFVEIGMQIKASSPFRQTLVMSLANDVDYYIPTRRAFEEGSYEVTTCPLQPGCGEALAATAIKLLEGLKDRPSR